MLTAEVTIYGEGGESVWEQIKVVPNVMEGVDYIAEIRSTIRWVFSAICRPVVELCGEFHGIARPTFERVDRR